VTTVAIHQPNYLPWIGFFAKALNSDVLVLLDTVQFPKRSYVNRVQVKTPHGAHWLTQPVLTTGRYWQAVCSVEFADPAWGLAHTKALQRNYARAPYFRAYFEPLAELLLNAGPMLTDCNERLIRWVLDLLELRTKLVRASSLAVESEDATERLIRLVQAVGGDTYLSGSGGFGYQDVGQFRAAGLRVLRAPSTFPEYPQLWGPFVPGLSTVDLLFNHGPKSRSCLEAAGVPA
jgi:hypothetical protein